MGRDSPTVAEHSGNAIARRRLRAWRRDARVALGTVYGAAPACNSSYLWIKLDTSANSDVPATISVSSAPDSFSVLFSLEFSIPVCVLCV